MIGNSRLHWAYFQGNTLQKTWNSPHLCTCIDLQQFLTLITPMISPYTLSEKKISTKVLPIYLASVVPEQRVFWENYPYISIIKLENLPLKGLYPTLGIDRALAVLGCGVKYGFPCLVIDAGTALTFTGVNSDCYLVGGAIIPGLSLQLQSLSRQTAALPLVSLPAGLPPRWSISTPEAITSGVIYTLMAGIKDFIQQWWHQFPDGQIVLTGGDGEQLLNYFRLQSPQIAAKLLRDNELIFQGMQALFY
jgi:type III pantothenate kinase